MHSFILLDLMSKLKRLKKKLDEMLLVSTPLGRILLVIDGINGNEIKIGKLTTEGNLVVLDMEDFDIILGMDWLSKYYACVNYFHKTITFQSKDVCSACFKENR